MPWVLMLLSPPHPLALLFQSPMPGAQGLRGWRGQADKNIYREVLATLIPSRISSLKKISGIWQFQVYTKDSTITTQSCSVNQIHLLQMVIHWSIPSFTLFFKFKRLKKKWTFICLLFFLWPWIDFLFLRQTTVIHCLWFPMLVSLKCSQNLKCSSLTPEWFHCYLQLVIFASLPRAPYWWHEASSHILTKICHFFESDIHKYFRNITCHQPSVHIILIAVQYILEICSPLDDKTTVESFRKLLKRTKSVENRGGKKKNLSVWNIMGEEQWLSGSFSKLCWVGKFSVFWIHFTFQESLKAKKLCIQMI